MKIKVGVIFGGKSVEHEVSIISAIQAINNIDKEKYDVLPIYMTKENDLYAGLNLGKIENYKNIKKQLSEKEKKLDKANEQTNKLDNTTKDINQILDNLKPAKFNKNNMVISNEDVEKIKNYTKDANSTTKTVRSVNDLNLAIKDFERTTFETIKEVSSLKYEIILSLISEALEYPSGFLIGVFVPHNKSSQINPKERIA